MFIIFSGLGCAVAAYVGITYICRKVDSMSERNEKMYKEVFENRVA